MDADCADNAREGPIGFGVRWVGDDLVYPAAAAGRSALTKWRVSTGTTEIIARSAGNHTVRADGSRIVCFDFDTGELWKAEGTRRDRIGVGQDFAGGANARLSRDGRLLPTIAPSPNGSVVRVVSMDDPRSVREITATGVRPGGV